MFRAASRHRQQGDLLPHLDFGVQRPPRGQRRGRAPGVATMLTSARTGEGVQGGRDCCRTGRAGGLPLSVTAPRSGEVLLDERRGQRGVSRRSGASRACVTRWQERFARAAGCIASGAARRALGARHVPSSVNR